MSFQPSLFGETEKQLIHLHGGEMVYFPRWLSRYDDQCLADVNAHDIFTVLKQTVAWEQSVITIYGRQVKVPRLNAWYGDRYSQYHYSGAYFTPLPWLPLLHRLKSEIENSLVDYLEGVSFNSALVNLYRHGQDGVAWHSDDEPELGANPLVASLSLGAERLFQLRHRYNKDNKQSLLLSDGDLLLMYGAMQHNWHHQIPKTTQSVGERINITFRYIQR